MSRRRFFIIGFALLSVAFGLLLAIVAILQRDPGIEPLAPSTVELSKTVEGIEFKLLRDGRLFRVDSGNGRWHFHQKVYHPEEMLDSYVTEGDSVYRRDPDSKERAKIRVAFTEDFEGVSQGVKGIRELVGIERGWGALTLQSPESREVKDYVALRNRILKGEADFGDCLVAPDNSKSHSGSNALKCIAPAKPSGMVTCKASLSSPLMYVRNGDDFWYRAWYYIEDSRPFTIMDLECEWIEQHSGIRLCIDEQGALWAELKALDKPRFLQSSENKTIVPLDKWFEVATHIHISNVPNEGHVKIWQDGKLIVDSKGQTLPLETAIYSSLEIGISAHSYGNQKSTLWVDDVEVSNTQFPDMKIQR